MAEPQEISTLRRRGRRRLVGAIALVLLAVIVLPMVFDSEPRQSVPPVSVRIPSEDDAGFSPKVTPKTPPVRQTVPAAPVEPPQPKAKAPEKPAAERPIAEKPSPEKAIDPDAEQKRAEAVLADAQFIIPIIALANADKLNDVTAALKEAKVPYYTEPGAATPSGPVTRVRAGPFPSRAAAEKALEPLRGRLKSLGIKPGNVTPKS